MQRESDARSTSKGRRRVPPELRKRAAVSCDFCKTRRRKCVRESLQGPCKLCKANNVSCTSTVSHKPRSHTPADQSSPAPHYRALEDLVSKIFPGVPIDDIGELTRLSQDIESGGTSFLHSRSPSGTFIADSTANRGTDNDVTSDHLVLAPSSSLPQPEGHSNLSYPASVYERLLQNPAGTLSYFGPSSSMAYVRKMRELLHALGAKHDAGTLPDTQQRLRDDFIQDKYAHTMGDGPDGIPDLKAPEILQPLGGGQDLRRPTAASATRLQKLLNILPNKQETEELVDLFYTHVHANMPLFHRSSFQSALDRLRSPDTGAIDAGWAVCFRLVVAFGCEWRLSSMVQGDADSRRLASLRKQLVGDSLQEIQQLMLSASLQSVAALTLISLYLIFANERNASWMLTGCAIRMAIGLGLHRGEDLIRRSNITFAPVDKELRRQIWCSLYIFEQYTSSTFGRPSAVDGIEIPVELPRESILDQGFYQPPGLLYHDISLARILSNVRSAQVDQSLHPSNDWQGLPDVGTCNTLLKELENWHEVLPSFLTFDESRSHQIYPNHLRQIVMMHVRYQYTRILLSRPFLLKALFISHALKPAQVLDAEIAKYKQICFLSARDSCSLICHLWKAGQYNARLWLDGVFAYQSTLILSLCLLDSLKMSNAPQHEKIQQMVEEMMEVLQKAPGNRTMTRLVQISLDFNKIVSSLSLNHQATGASIPPLGASQESVIAIHNQPVPEAEPRAEYDTSDVPPFSWESLVGPEWYHGDFMDANFRVDASMDDIAIDAIDY